MFLSSHKCSIYTRSGTYTGIHEYFRCIGLDSNSSLGIRCAAPVDTAPFDVPGKWRICPVIRIAFRHMVHVRVEIYNRSIWVCPLHKTEHVSLFILPYLVEGEFLHLVHYHFRNSLLLIGRRRRLNNPLAEIHPFRFTS